MSDPGALEFMKSSRHRLNQICQQYGIHILYAFGSQSKKIRELVEGQRSISRLSSSDVDIGVKAKSGERLSVAAKVNLALALEDLLGCERVDLVSLSEADPFLAAEVIRGERLFARDEYEADEYELFILRRAGDLAPLERERMALILGEST